MLSNKFRADGYICSFFTQTRSHILVCYESISRNLVEHDLDVVAGVPVAVVTKAAGLFEDARQLHAARAHVVNVSIGVLAAVFFAMQEVCEGNMAASIHVHHVHHR